MEMDLERWKTVHNHRSTSLPFPPTPHYAPIDSFVRKPRAVSGADGASRTDTTEENL
jgi:hypothetical protein